MIVVLSTIILLRSLELLKPLKKRRKFKDVSVRRFGGS